LTLLFAACPGDGKELGINRLAHDGLFKRVIGSHYALAPKLAEMAMQNKFEAYNLPLGAICHLFRDIGAHRPGSFSKVGLRTFVDPRLGGGKLNAITKEDLVELHEIHGDSGFSSNVFDQCRIAARNDRRSGRDVTMGRALPLDGLSIATAARNCGGLSIVQVERVAASDPLTPAKSVFRVSWSIASSPRRT
jgi:propionate CoA-transferase